MMLDVQLWRAGEPGIGKLSAGCHQLALPQGVFHLRGVFVHIITPEDWHELPAGHAAHGMWVHAGRWISRYEIGEHIVEV